MARAFIAVGSNIEPTTNVLAGIAKLAQEACVAAISTVYRTGAFGRSGQPDYFNCVVEIQTDLTPFEVKHDLLRPIESLLGRVRGNDKSAPRPIDLDLIVYGDMEMRTKDIRLPDPDILERSFLALPLLELAPDLVLPGFDLPIAEVAAKLPKNELKPLDDYTRLLRRTLGVK